MTSLDVREMLDLPSAAGSRTAKKPKSTVPRPNLKGLQREVQSLGGDNPISIVSEAPLFKKRRLASRKPTVPWEMKPFKNSARTDGLVLRHWRRKAEIHHPTVSKSHDGQGNAPVPEVGMDDSVFSKFNVHVDLPKYNDEQYESKLRDDNWSKEETDYLTTLAQDFDLRWPVIWDRYDYKSTPAPQSGEGESQIPTPERKVRNLEDLKARYYSIAATMMTVHRPIQYMSQAEFNLHQLMMSFNPAQEKTRKQFAAAAMSRSAEERREEESLLIELKRIMTRSEKLNEERKELYARLEVPPSTSNVGIYTSSQGLQQLVQHLMNADKSKKRKSLLGPEGVSPASGSSGHPQNVDRRDSGHRDSISASNKKASVSNPSERRQLTQAEEALYGVSRHERLTGGPSFRHDRVTRQITSKSAVQASKITNTLNELEIPPRLVMPTQEVTIAYEGLLNSVNTLLDTKKLLDKLDGEIKLAEAQKVERERKEKKEKGEPESETEAEEDAERKNKDALMADVEREHDEDEKVEQTEAERGAMPTTKASSTMHKRSASVLSQISDKSSKRQRK
ncbi:MAG: swr complex subunit [Claussenomyces sp. TS43310]|nr:MAG: swr complex subunit [Claussenomyces sp. TS43310]